MRSYMIMGLMLLAASPATALKITNLDDVPHRVALEGRGEVIVQEVAVGATEYMTGSSQGMLSLVELAPPASKGKKRMTKRPANHGSLIKADGMLAGIVGDKSRSVHADPDSSYVIWQGGDLRLQSRTKDAQGR